MLPRTRSTFRLDDLQGNPSPLSSISEKSVVEEQPRSIRSSANPIGLRILIEKSQRETNIIDKSMLRSSRPGFPTGRSPVTLPELSFLQACFLCRKALSPEKDVYIYRGDQGFCSLECRCRQIFMDERKEIRERWGAPVDRSPSPSCRLGQRQRGSTRRRRVPAAA